MAVPSVCFPNPLNLITAMSQKKKKTKKKEEEQEEETYTYKNIHHSDHMIYITTTCHVMPIVAHIELSSDGFPMNTNGITQALNNAEYVNID